MDVDEAAVAASQEWPDDYAHLSPLGVENEMKSEKGASQLGDSS